MEFRATVRVLAELVPQPLDAITEIAPPLPSAVTVMEAEPCPAVTVQPVGTVQA